MVSTSSVSKSFFFNQSSMFNLIKSSEVNGLPLIQKLVYNMNIVDGLTVKDLSKLIEIDLIDVNRELINARENIKKKLLLNFTDNE